MTMTYQSIGLTRRCRFDLSTELKICNRLKALSGVEGQPTAGPRTASSAVVDLILVRYRRLIEKLRLMAHLPFCGEMITHTDIDPCRAIFTAISKNRKPNSM